MLQLAVPDGRREAGARERATDGWVLGHGVFGLWGNGSVKRLEERSEREWKEVCEEGEEGEGRRV